jgi:hypothetical protein
MLTEHDEYPIHQIADSFVPSQQQPFVEFGAQDIVYRAFLRPLPAPGSPGPTTLKRF